jgi:hypothetical protein
MSSDNPTNSRPALDWEAAHERWKCAARQLSERGWLADLDFPIQMLNAVNVLYKKKDFTAIDDGMAAYTERTVSDVVARHCEQDWPHRWPILKPALKAHKKKQYALCIPVFLAQADGMCQEIFGVKLYGRSKNGIPHTALKVAALQPDKATATLLEPLLVASSFNAYDEEAKLKPAVVNRHEVLHGVSVTYATKTNSLRAISLLYYVAFTVPHLKKMCDPAYIEQLRKEGEEMKAQIKAMFDSK